MAEQSVFDRLVRTLTKTGRRDLLEKLQNTMTDRSEPLKTKNPEDERTVDVEAGTEALGPMMRILYFLWSLITGRDLRDLIKDRLIRRLRSQLDEAYDGLMNYRASTFTGRFYEELEELQKGVVFFRDPLESVMGGSRGEFYAFLAGIELDFEDRLRNALPSLHSWDSIELDEDASPKNEVVKILDGIFEGLPAEEKSLVYRDAQALYYLYKLTRHSLVSMLGSFHPAAGNQGQESDFGSLVKSLTQLSELLFSLELSPSVEGLRALFLFYHHDRFGSSDFDPDAVLHQDLSEAEEALMRIRAFNDRIPLTFIIRYITKNLNYHPSGIGGAEDWFVSFKDFWYRRLDRAFTDLGRRKRKKAFMYEAGTFLGISELSSPAYLQTAPFNGNIQARHWCSLVFVDAFHDRVFKKMERYLQVILAKGEFYKEQNRNSFSEDIDYMTVLPTRLAYLARRFERDGDLGMRYRKLDDEVLDDPAKADRVLEIVAEFDREVLGLVDRVYQHLTDMQLIVGGILHGKPGDNFDTLINLERIGGEENQRLRMLWGKAEDALATAVNLLRDIRQLETD